MNNDITVVTCFFQIRSKYSTAEYFKWIENFLKIPMKLVIYTDVNSVEFIKKVSNQNTTRIILLNISEFYMFKYMDYFKYCHSIDPETEIGHTPELYLIWAEKSWFIKRAVESNYFNTDWFFWCDIGCFR